MVFGWCVTSGKDGLFYGDLMFLNMDGDDGSDDAEAADASPFDGSGGPDTANASPYD